MEIILELFRIYQEKKKNKSMSMFFGPFKKNIKIFENKLFRSYYSNSNMKKNYPL